MERRAFPLFPLGQAELGGWNKVCSKYGRTNKFPANTHRTSVSGFVNTYSLCGAGFSVLLVCFSIALRKM